MNRFCPIAMPPGQKPGGATDRFLGPLRTAARDDAGAIAIDVSLRDGIYRVWADLPGVARSAVVVSVEGNTVRIDALSLTVTSRSAHGDVPACAGADGAGADGARSRSFAVPYALDERRASALFGCGVLIVELPLLDPAPMVVPLPVPAITESPWLSARARSSRWRPRWLGLDRHARSQT